MLLVVKFLGDPHAEGQDHARLGVAQFMPHPGNSDTTKGVSRLVLHIDLTGSAAIQDGGQEGEKDL